MKIKPNQLPLPGERALDGVHGIPTHLGLSMAGHRYTKGRHNRTANKPHHHTPMGGHEWSHGLRYSFSQS
jgi:hypothetical protein